jgi:hypothetical protein
MTVTPLHWYARFYPASQIGDLPMPPEAVAVLTEVQVKCCHAKAGAMAGPIRFVHGMF